ncbi:hypothetical protein EJ05DRAFT_482260 [Pseudovirgaria hyperparasitica]|uniref:WSC domain-containing protein n=1 Tax=Pseudovirgaria hyperparasitica TaxID=470096 RepID=A0A6A6WML8_9PEZI|nr:uncharacterized protein EJ05DRAFT_482260 [Pseudovirgaria hyperparasitica]KAF2763460.1 hypothetical protein EJ05DRAFT_482260 [Pseudovirgaria hyperparasitica]
MGGLAPTWMSFVAVSWLCLAFAHGQSTLFRQSYCSSQNTGSDYPVDINMYQSNGACHDRCNSEGYALAIVQYTSCWCSNLIPGTETSVDNCNVDCPGYPDEKCGDQGRGLYGYVTLDRRPSGTADASSPSSTPSQVAAPSSTSTKETVTDEHTIVQTVEPDTSVVTSIVSLTPRPASPSSSSQNSEPQTFVSTKIVSGTPVTEFVTTYPTNSPGSSQQNNDNDDSGVSGGTIAGAVVGGVGGLAALAGLVFFLIRRRRQNSDDYNGDDKSSGPRRHVSTMSKTGLLRSRSVKEPPAIAVPPIVYRQGSSHGQESTHSDHASTGLERERRNSRPMFYDQRLNPSALLGLENSSRTSLGTIEDNRDYTRTLNVRNPDPE